MKKDAFLYQTIYKDLKDSILSNIYPENSLLPTEQILAEKYQVNRSTIRKATQLLINDGLIEKCPGRGTTVLSHSILEHAELPSPHRNIGFLLPSANLISEPFYSSLFGHLEQFFQASNCSLIYTTLEEEDDLLAKISTLRLSGVLFVTSVSEKHIDAALKNHIPCVLINGYNRQIPSVLSDNQRGAYLAGKHLLQLGHTNPALLTGIRGYVSNAERLRGFQHAYWEAGLQLNPDWIINANSWNFEEAEQVFYQFLIHCKGPLPTAVFAFNDRLAIGTINAIKKAGLRVPEDISVIGYDNIPFYNILGYQLTTIDTHIDIIAGAAASPIISMLNHSKMVPIKALCQVDLIPGTTVGPIHTNNSISMKNI